jgi:hypothetical protein
VLHPNIVIFSHNTNTLFLDKLGRRFGFLASLVLRRHPGLDVACDLENVAGLVGMRLDEDGLAVAWGAEGGDEVDVVRHSRGGDGRDGGDEGLGMS